MANLTPAYNTFARIEAQPRMVYTLADMMAFIEESQRGYEALIQQMLDTDPAYQAFSDAVHSSAPDPLPEDFPPAYDAGDVPTARPA